MKKTILTISLILGLTMTTFADGGLFQRGYNAKNGFSGYTYFNTAEFGDRTDPSNAPMLPAHGSIDSQSAPVGSGIAVLVGLGAAYLVGKKRREE